MGPMNLWELLVGGNAAPAEAMGPHPVDGEQFPGIIIPKAPIRMLDKRPQQIPPQQPTTVMPDMETVPAGPAEPFYRGPASMPKGRSAAGLPPGVQTPGVTNPARDEISNLLAMQQQEIDRQRELYDQAAAMEPQADLRPIAAFVDSMTGSKSAAAAAPSFTQADKLKLMSQLRENVAQGQEKLTSAKLRQALGEEGLDMRKLAMIMSGTKREVADAEKETRMELKIGQIATNLHNAMERHPLVKKLAEQNLSFDQLDDLMALAAEGNATVFSSIGTKMAKAMGEVGVLTENDVKRYVQSNKLDRKFEDRFKTWASGNPSAATMTDLKHIAAILKQSAGKKINALYDQHAKVLSRNFNMPMTEAYERLGIPVPEKAPAGSAASTSGAKAAAAPPSGGLTPEEKAELEALRKKKASGQ